MAMLSHAESGRMYSWWWDSHISPKNSRWLQENLTDTDSRVKTMIKLLEEDADSFARRADMYYKKRPELMKLVEEFYRAYRALAEKYDHATGALRQAHRTMAEAFPNQVPLALIDDEPMSYASEIDPQTPNDELKQWNDSFGSGGVAKSGVGRMQRGLNFDEVAEKEQCMQRVGKPEKEIESLGEDIAKFEGEKDSTLTQNKQGLEKFSNQELEFSNQQEDSEENRAEEEVKSLRQALSESESKNKASLLQYQQCLERIEKLESIISLAQKNVVEFNERAQKAESDKATFLDQYKESLEKMSDMETKLVTAEENAKKLKGAEEQLLLLERLNHSLNSELASLKLKVEAQSEELVEKEREVSVLLASVQGEHMRFVEAETAFQTLHLLHSQTEEELRCLAIKLSNMETHNRSLLSEVLKMKEENETLNEFNIASSMSVKDMQIEISSLTKTKQKLEEEVELQVDQRNALQQEIYCLKEELGDFHKKYHPLWDQIEALGFNPACLHSSVKVLQDENANLKDIRDREMGEKRALLEKVEYLERIVEENARLEKSLFEEKSTLVLEKEAILTQLQVVTENLQKLSERNTFMENSVSDAHDEIEGLKMSLNSSEDFCRLLENEKSDLVNDRVATASKLEDLEKKYEELEDKYSAMEKEKELTLYEVEKFQLTVKESEKKEEKRVTEIENLCGKVLDMQKASLALQEENLKLLDEKIALEKVFLDLQERNNTLEGEIFFILGETESLSNLTLIFKNIMDEKLLELKEIQLEHLRLRELLGETEEKWFATRSVNGRLNDEIKNGKDLLYQKEIEIAEARSKVTALENEKLELQKIVVDLKSKYNEIKMLWDAEKHERETEESEATKIFGELFISFVFRALLVEKFTKLTEALETIEKESICKDGGIKLLEERISSLEGENGVFRAELAAYFPAIDSLRDCISSLETITQNCNNEKVKEAKIESHVGRREGLGTDQKEANKILELQDLEAMVKAIEKRVIEMNGKLESAMRQIEELGFKGAPNQENVRPENGCSTKDIMLDQISDCSSYGIGGRQCISTNSQRTEPWNVDDLEGKKKNTVPTMKGVGVSSGVIVGKQSREDNSVISKAFSWLNQDVSKSKILERLNSEAQKLTNLQIAMQYLKRKLEMIEKRREGKSCGERESIEALLSKAEEDIKKMFDLNGQLLRSVDNFDDYKSVVESEDDGNLRSFSEQARKVFERIGQLQLEAQRIQLVLLKLDDESERDEGKRKPEITDTGRTARLRDYLGLRSGNRRNRGALCACLSPRTK